MVFIVSIEPDCFIAGNLWENDLNKCGDKTDTPQKCQELCEETAGCVQFTWLHKNYWDGRMDKSCCMKKRLNYDYKPEVGSISGPKWCG